MPAIVNIHAHFGYEKYLKAEGLSRAEHFTDANLLDHLQRQAYFGVGTVLDAGSGSLPVTQKFQADQRAGRFANAARLNLMGGIVPVNGGPDHILIQGTRALKANYEVTLSPEARTAVQDLKAKGVQHVKIWLGDRNGTYPAMPHEVYDAVIDEAHKAGIKVHAHATNLRDQKDAIRAGIDVLVHTVQNAPLDDELVALLKDKRPYWTTVFGLGDRSEVCDQNPFVLQVLTDDHRPRHRGHRLQAESERGGSRAAAQRELHEDDRRGRASRPRHRCRRVAALLVRHGRSS